MDYKIVIDAGHGGDDPGASGNGIIEKDLTLKISQYMYDRFRDLGIPVKMTRTTDETLSPTERVNRVLDAFGNNKNVILISNHINAGGEKGPCGDQITFFGIYKKDNCKFQFIQLSFYISLNYYIFL